MNQNVDYDYDEVIQYCQGEGQNSINELANSLNALSNEMESCQDAFHSKGNQMVIGEIYDAFSAIIGSTSTNNGVSGLDAESAKILNVCYSEAMKDKSILESDILGDGSGSTPTGDSVGEPAPTESGQQPAPEQQPEPTQEAEPTPEQVQEPTQEAEPAPEAAPEQTPPADANPSNGGSVLNKQMGVNQGPSGKETYYNLDMSRVVENMHNQGFEGEYWVRDDGVKMFGDYVIVAANLDVHPRGSIVESSLGPAIVCDTGGFAESDPNQLDIATSW